MVHLITASVQRMRDLVPELAKFGVVGATGSVVDLGGSALLYGTFHLGPITSKAIALSAACVVTYLGSRFWTFRHRENQAVHRELILFIVLNAIGLAIAEVVIGTTAYAFGAKDQIAYNVASVIGTGIGTIFRFWAYRKWVFLAPAAAPSTAPAAAARQVPEGQPNGTRMIMRNVTVVPAHASPPAAGGQHLPSVKSAVSTNGFGERSELPGGPGGRPPGKHQRGSGSRSTR